MQYPNKIQSCILLQEDFGGLDAVVDSVRDIFQNQAGITFSTPEERPGFFYHLFGQQDDLMITFEYCDHQADSAYFEQALSSSITEIYCSDVRQRISSHQSHLLINIWHGVLGGVEDDRGISEVLESIGKTPDGATAGQFNNRLNALRLITHVACDQAPASVVHWTQSNQLFSAEMFCDLVQKGAAIPIAVHPILYGYQSDAQGRHSLGIKSFGVQHFLGREVFIKPNILPWHANYSVICMFLEMALARDGVVTADHFLLAPEDKSFGYLCIHHDQPDEGEEPEYELVPMWHNEHGYITDDPEQRAALLEMGIGTEDGHPNAEVSADQPSDGLAQMSGPEEAPVTTEEAGAMNDTPPEPVVTIEPKSVEERRQNFQGGELGCDASARIRAIRRQPETLAREAANADHTSGLSGWARRLLGR